MALGIPDITSILIFTQSFFWNTATTGRGKWVCSSVRTIQWPSQGLKSVCVAKMLIHVASKARFSPAQVLLRAPHARAPRGMCSNVASSAVRIRVWVIVKLSLFTFIYRPFPKNGISWKSLFVSIIPGKMLSLINYGFKAHSSNDFKYLFVLGFVCGFLGFFLNIFWAFSSKNSWK